MYYQSENVIEEFYKNLLDSDNPERVHIPMSDVFYVREAMRQDTGVTYSLDHVEWAMRKESYYDHLPRLLSTRRTTVI
jgi:hypothetical protein